MRKGGLPLSSSAKRRQQKIPKGSCLQEATVNPSGPGGAPSYATAREGKDTCSQGNLLMERVVERNNMFKALHRVESNRGACGVDGLEVKDLRHYLREHWLTIREQLLGDNYRPSPVRRVEIPKPEGGVRMLGIPHGDRSPDPTGTSATTHPSIRPRFLRQQLRFSPWEAGA